MHTETLLLEFMARVNDALKSDASETDKLKAVYRAKQWSEDEYANIASDTTEQINAMDQHINRDRFNS